MPERDEDDSAATTAMAGPALEQHAVEVTRLRDGGRGERGWASGVSAPDALFVVDGDGRIALVNGQAEQLFGYQRAELIGHSIDLLVPASLRGQHARHRASYAHAPTTRPMGTAGQQRGMRKDGSEFPAEVSLSPVPSTHGQADGYRRRARRQRASAHTDRNA